MGSRPDLAQKVPQPPVELDCTPSSLIEESKAIIAQTNKVWDNIVAAVKPEDASFTNVILPIIQDENVRMAKGSPLRFYGSTAVAEDLRKAGNEAIKLFSDADIDLFHRADVFALVDAASKRLPEDLDAESKYYVENLLHKFRNNGCGMANEEEKAAFLTRKKRSQELVQNCLVNLEEDKSGLWLAAEELTGVPKSIVEGLKPGDGENEGKFWLPAKLPHPPRILKHASKESTRKKVYYAMRNRVPENVAMHQELYALRHKVATELGFKHHFDFRTRTDSMMGSPEAVLKVIEQVQSRLAPVKNDEADGLLALKKLDAEGDKDAVKIFQWDSMYYERIYQNQLQQSQADVSEYFELYHTLDKLLELFGTLFDTRFEKIDSSMQAKLTNKPLVMHEDVLIYAVWDTRGPSEFLGYAYLDLLPRPGKYGHFGCYTLQPVSIHEIASKKKRHQTNIFNQRYEDQNGNPHYASVALVMNFIKGKAPRPTLLNLRETRRLFHELGHVHHILLMKVRHAASTNVNRDFGEIPSIMLEQLLFQERPIQDLSYHYSYISPEYKTVWQEDQSEGAEQPPVHFTDEQASLHGEPGPRDAINSLNFALFLSMYDITVHQPESLEAIESLNSTELYNKLRTQLTGFPGGEEDGDGWEYSHGQASYRGIVGGYDAAYYSYIL